MSASARAFGAEAYRLGRNGNALFWGFLFVPGFYLLVGLVLDLAMLNASARLGAGTSPLWRATKALAVGGNPLAHLFLAAGAAALFGGEYRFATWRILCPRVPRRAILRAKWALYLLAIAAVLMMLFLGTLGESWLVSLVTGAAAGTGSPAVTLPGLAIAMAGTFLELAAFGSAVAVATIATRSVTAPILILFLFSVGQTLANSMLPQPPDFSLLLLMPSAAGDATRRFALAAGGVTPVSVDAALASILVLASWTLAALAVALAIFTRQDLSRE